MRDCQYKPRDNCESRPSGVGGAVHCIMCQLDAGRKLAAAAMQQQEKRDAEFKAHVQLRLNRLRAEVDDHHFRSRQKSGG